MNAALAVAKARGVKLGTNGKRLAEKHKAEAEAEAFTLTLVPVVYELHSEGLTTVREITHALNQRGISSREGGRWHLISVSMLLRRLNNS